MFLKNSTIQRPRPSRGAGQGERERERERASKKGFTLIELLVVISIIGFLATAAMVAFNMARMNARDTKRLAGIKQIQTALELFYDDNGYYPKRDGGTNRYGYAFSDWGSHCGGWWCTLETYLAPYIKPLPRDPNGEIQLGYYYSYRTHGNGQSYGLAGRLERANDAAINDGGCENNHYEVGPSLSRCGCSPYRWEKQGTDLCP